MSAVLHVGVQEVDVLEVVGEYEPSCAGAWFGNLEGLGDIDLDGYADFAIQQYGSGGCWHPGRVYVVSGFNRGIISRFEGDVPSSILSFGSALALGAVGPAGEQCLLIGDREAATLGGPDGELLITDPLRGSVIARLPAIQGGSRFGSVVASGADLNNDGIDEFCVGATTAGPGGQRRFGAVVLYDGATRNEIFRVYGDPGEQMPSSLDFIVDQDGDGIEDILVGSPYYSSNIINRGRVLVLSGATGQTIWSKVGSYQGEALGSHANVIGDLTGDGVNEVAWAEDGWCHVVVYDGRTFTSLLDLDLASTVFVVGPVQQAPDLNGDGFPDFVVNGVDPVVFSGQMVLLSGADGRVLEVILHPLGVGFPSAFANEIAVLGDVTGDGQVDFAATMGGTINQNGTVYLFQTRSLYRELGRTSRVPGQASPLSLRLEAPALPHHGFALLFSTSARQGTQFGLRTIPLDPTPMLVSSATAPVRGRFDAQGQAIVPVVLPAHGLLPTPRRIHVCWVGLDSEAPANVRAISNAISIPVR